MGRVWTLSGLSVKRESVVDTFVVYHHQTLGRYAKARTIKEEQDRFCSNVLNGNWNLDDSRFPEEMQWEALVDVLRGRVKVNNSIAL